MGQVAFPASGIGIRPDQVDPDMSEKVIDVPVKFSGFGLRQAPMAGGPA